MHTVSAGFHKRFLAVRNYARNILTIFAKSNKEMLPSGYQIEPNFGHPMKNEEKRNGSSNVGIGVLSSTN